MVVTFDALNSVAPQAFTDTATMWASIRDQFDRQRADYHQEVVEPVDNDCWQGAAASAARQRIHRTSARLDPTHTYLDTAQFLLRQAASGIKTAKARCADGIKLAGSIATPIDATGMPDISARPPDNVDWDQPAVWSAMRAANLIYQSRVMADHVDSNVSRLLNNATKFATDAWTRDADADHEDARFFAKNMPGVLAEIAVDEGQPAPDTPAQPYNVATPSATDLNVYNILRAGVLNFLRHGWTHASTLLTEWLNNSGNTVAIDPREMVDQIPALRTAVAGWVDAAGTDRLGRPRDGVTTIDSGWRNCAATEGDWYWALHDFRYRVVGISAVVDGKRGTEFTVGVVKPYVFGDSANGVHRTPVPLIPHTPVKLDQARIQHLHTTGMARNFIAHGMAHFTG